MCSRRRVEGGQNLILGSTGLIIPAQKWGANCFCQPSARPFQELAAFWRAIEGGRAVDSPAGGESLRVG